MNNADRDRQAVLLRLSPAGQAGRREGEGHGSYRTCRGNGETVEKRHQLFPLFGFNHIIGV